MAEVLAHVVPVESPSRVSPGTIPISVFRKVGQERDLAIRGRDTARVAARAVPLVEQELANVKRKLQKLQDDFVASERQWAVAEARYYVLPRSKGLRPEVSATIQSPAAAASASAAPSRTGESVTVLAAGLMEHAQLSTRLMADAQSSCGQLRTIVGLARQTSLPQLALEDLPKMDKTLRTRLIAVDARFPTDLIAAAKQPSWVGEVGS